ncbi:hypothetical protein HK104_011370 [Borealophlyctis nickersoniae]|nr:hypothetical protein HK104_011370 [Borealophlyctis nickersoniae]
MHPPPATSYGNVPARTDSNFDRVRSLLRRHSRERPKLRSAPRSFRRSSPPQSRSKSPTTITTTTTGGVGGDGQSQNRSSLARKTEELVKAAAVISETLRNLESGILAEAAQVAQVRKSENGESQGVGMQQPRADTSAGSQIRKDENGNVMNSDRRASCWKHSGNPSSIFARPSDLEGKSVSAPSAPEVVRPAVATSTSDLPSSAVPVVQPGSRAGPRDRVNDPNIPLPSAPALVESQSPTFEGATASEHYPSPNSPTADAQYPPFNPTYDNDQQRTLPSQGHENQHPPDPGPQPTKSNNTDAVRRALRRLEKENIHLKAKLEAKQDFESEATAKLHRRILALEDENRRLQTTTRTLPRTTDSTVEFLRQKVSHLEKENTRLTTKLAETARLQSDDDRIHELTDQCEAAQAEAQELHMRVSRQNMELKSLLEQNSILRKENKRLIEQEVGLKRRLLEVEAEVEAGRNSMDRDDGRGSTSGSSHTRARTPNKVDEEARQGLLRLIEDEIRRIGDKKRQITSTHVGGGRSRHADVDWSLSAGLSFASPRILDAMVMSLDNARLAVSSAHYAANPQQFLSTCGEVVQVVVTCAGAIHLALEDSVLVDERIQRIREDSVKVREETERTIRDLADRYAADVRTLQGDNRTLEQNLITIQKDLAKIKQEYADERARRKQLEATREADRDLASAREKSLIEETSAAVEQTATAAVLDSELRLKDHVARIDDLTAENTRLKAHAEVLERTIAEWKTECATLRDALHKTELAPVEVDEKVMKLQGLVDKLEERVEDEKLKNRKAAELIKSFKEDLEVAKKDAERVKVAEEANGPSSLEELEHTMKERLDDLERRGRVSNTYLGDLLNGQETDVLAGLFSSGGLGNAQDVEALLALLKENQDTADQLSQLSGMIEDQVKRANTLKSENATLADALSETKDKLKLREEAWLGKFETLQSALESIRKQHTDVETLLLGYEKQYKAVALLVHDTDADTPSDCLRSEGGGSCDHGHPYPFATRFSHLHNLYVSSKHSMSLLHQKLADLARTAEERLTRVESLEGQHAETREEAERAKREAEERGRRVAELEKTLGQVEEQKRAAESKLKRIVNGCKVLMGGPVPFKGYGNQ